ncbi:GNAT family N-acetyltransferase [Patulibacter minatonensis]|uniref:GNAT family N-acetyltransferase n=1 Tax=Patulibacter minatonensis TaxID=298163 RepID=UPI00047927A8|nr:GNAT family N-acetyltransferase [Patulibacter minatonensis]
MRVDVRTDRLRIADVGTADRAAWAALAGRALEPNPFFEPGLAMPAARHLPGGGRAELLVVRTDERWLACVPVRRRPKWSDLLLPCVRAWNHDYCFLSTPLVDRDALDVAAHALRAAPRRWPGRAFLALEAMGDGPLAGALPTHAAPGRPAPAVHSGFDRAVLRRRPDDTYVDGAASGRRRRERRRTRRILERELGGTATLVDATEDPAALDRLLALEAAGWKGAAGTALTSDPEHEAFVRETWDDFHGRGRGHLLELRVGDRIAASVLCLSAGDVVFSLKMGHDETLRAGAPGVHLMADAATWFHGRPEFALFDSCAVRDNAMINALWPDRRRIVSPVLPAGGLPGRAAQAALRRHALRAGPPGGDTIRP